MISIHGTKRALASELDAMHIPEKDDIMMDVYYESERKKTYEQLEKSLKNTKKKLKVYRDKEKHDRESLAAHMKWQEEEDRKNEIDYNCPG